MSILNAYVAQLDRVLPSEGKGHEFESHRKHHFCLNINMLIGKWLNLVERYVRDVEVAGSNPVFPTIIDVFMKFSIR